MEWEHFGNQLLDEHKLHGKINDMNQVDLAKCGTTCIEQICHQIYDEHDSLKDHYEQIRDDFWKIIETIDYVHLHTSRIKSIDSLLVKVVTKRYRQMMDRKSRYAGINGSNYKDIMTDLIGLRFIVSYSRHQPAGTGNYGYHPGRIWRSGIGYLANREPPCSGEYRKKFL